MEVTSTPGQACGGEHVVGRASWGELEVGELAVGQPLVVRAQGASSHGLPMYHEVLPDSLNEHIPTELT